MKDLNPETNKYLEKVPSVVKKIWQILLNQNYQAYLVGGCVRDLVLGRKPKDWDITTNAKPQEILNIFEPDAFYDNIFGTVGVKTSENDPTLKVIEITTYRTEFQYRDFRHPEKIEFVNSLEEDLKRRDFTINAMALSIKGEIIDLFNGRKDLEEKLIRAVGEPEKRFQEDALRMIRAVRIAVELNFEIEKNTFLAIQHHKELIQQIAKERIRDELIKILMNERAAYGIELLRQSGLLKYIIPELEEGVKVKQNKHHIYDVYVHNLKSLDYSARQGFPLEVRLSALLHDIGKPRTKQGEWPDATFYGHEVVSAKMAKQILKRLKFPKEIINKVWVLIRYHMFVFDPEIQTAYAVRRLLRRVGKENIEALFQLREADRIGSGVPKAQPYRLRYLKYMVEKVSQDPISPKMLKINGHQIMEILSIPPGPKVGWVLDILLEEVLRDPNKNDFSYLQKRVQQLAKLSDQELENLAQKAKEAKFAFERERDQQLKAKFKIK